MKRDPVALQGREHDVLVIGGGIAGAWTVWEAASRGLKAALIELDDFGQATSWSSLKTAHGGLRHLQRFDIAGFRESVRERRALLRVAPEVVRPLSFAIPAPGVVDRAKFFIAGVANDILSADRNDGLRADRVIGASKIEKGMFVWQDAQITHTERLLMGVLHAATDAGAVVINRCRIEGVARKSHAFEVRATDMVGGVTLAVRARSIVNAAGGGIEAVANLLGDTCASPTLIRGVNVVLGRSLTPSAAIGARDRGRFLFLVPWFDRTMLGTLYDDGRPPIEDLIRDLIEAGQRAFPGVAIRREDVAAVQAGHVPGAQDGEPIYRSRLITHADSRLVSILTAKYTTARATAQAAIDSLGAALSIALPPSVTAGTGLSKARPLTGELAERIRWAQAEEMALSVEDAVRGRLPEGARGDDPSLPRA